MTRDRLLLFTRYPMPGQAKTRLIPALGAEGAADLQRQMTEHTLAQVKRLQVIRPVAVEIWFAGSGHNAGHNSDNDLDDRTRMADWLGADWVYQAQSQGDLGDRMANAFQAAFDQGMERVVVIGTDCPGLQADLMAQAFEALATQDLVLGDAIDGGYYLLGLRRSQPQLFMGIDWGAATVRSQTLEIAKRLGLAIGHLAPLADVDYPEDLSVWQNSQTRSPLSIIVPALNEAENLGKWQNLGGEGLAIEHILVDGGSTDHTVALARQQGLKVLASAPGRAKQMNRGAAIAQSDILLFLHADTQLPDHFLPLIQDTLAQPQVVAGAFDLAIASDQPRLRWVEWAVKWRSRLCQLPYGDQGIFLKAEVFWQLGGFADLPIMEDFDLIKRLHKLGKVAIVPAAVTTSARRWQRLGVWKTTVINQLVIAAYYLGVRGDRLARLYRRF